MFLIQTDSSTAGLVESCLNNGTSLYTEPFFGAASESVQFSEDIKKLFSNVSFTLFESIYLFDNSTSLVFSHIANIEKEGSQSIYVIFAKSQRVKTE
jgi:hypothetical protein